MTNLVDYRLVRDAETKQVYTEGAPVVTVFAPSNAAFEKLPLKLKFFLFSPFGENVLKKILQYHIVPTTVIHSGALNFFLFLLVHPIVKQHTSSRLAVEYDV